MEFGRFAGTCIVYSFVVVLFSGPFLLGLWERGKSQKWKCFVRDLPEVLFCFLFFAPLALASFRNGDETLRFEMYLRALELTAAAGLWVAATYLAGLMFPPPGWFGKRNASGN